MDEETARIVFQLHLEDLQELSRKSKGKQLEGETDDFQLALGCYEAELQTFKTFFTDKDMSSSIATAVHDDGPLITEFKAQERQAAEDRTLALQLHDGPVPANPVPGKMRRPPNEAEGQADDELVEKLAALYMFGPDQDEDEDDSESSQPESSAWAASRTGSGTSKPVRNTNKRQCVICVDYFEFYDVARAPCSHEYCRRCIKELFTRSLTDESLFPPRCCGRDIPAQANRIFLTEKLVGEFQAKKLERDTPNPTYCHRPECSIFIPPQFIRGDVGKCGRCSATTCTICKGASHSGDCPEDTATQEILQIAAENEWQRCPSCRRVVELRSGCHHITCRCRTQFCYVCAATWKTCNCPQWREDRLIERAAAVVDREIGDRVMPVEERAQRVEQAARQLVDDHECQHNSWKKIGGPRHCEECGNWMPIWLNVCRQCNIMVCRRCKYNRL